MHMHYRDRDGQGGVWLHVAISCCAVYRSLSLLNMLSQHHLPFATLVVTVIVVVDVLVDFVAVVVIIVVWHMRLCTPNN